MRISDWSSDVCSSDLPLLERAGIVDAEDVPLFTYYATRHFYASALIAQHVQEGMSREAMALAIRDAMGHATVTFTLQVYGHLFPKDDAAGKAQAAALEATLLGPAAAAIVDDGKPDDVQGLSQRDKKISYIKAVG